MHTLIIGLDAFDPQLFERLFDEGQMQNLGKYVLTGGYARFAVSNPPQSEVSWTSIATGSAPGSHGMFDFVHRDPKTYTLSVSLLPTRSGPFGAQFVPPHSSRTLFDQAVDEGYPATALWWPATFPARPESPVRTIPGLGTPDIHGKLGVGTLFSSDPGLKGEDLKTPVELLHLQGRGRYAGLLKGPGQKAAGGVKGSSLRFELEIDPDRPTRLTLGDRRLELQVGEWSPIVELSFKLGVFIKVQAITRVILTHSRPDPRLYFLPLQIHPLHSPWRYANPKGFVKRTWKTSGPFLTLGWPQDTTALEEGWISDEQFLDLCESIVDTQERILKTHLLDFDEGLMACVFDTLDRVQHMFWRDRPDVIERWYHKLDGLVGRIDELLAARGGPVRRLVVSDHGFTRYDTKVHLNRWLIQNGFLVADGQAENGSLRSVDWSQSRAYAVGLNSLYLNLAGREGQGCVSLTEKETLLARLREGLLEWKGPDSRPVVQRVHIPDLASDGPLVAYGPDALIGYTPGYRASAQTGLGGWEKTSLEPNRDHWGGDHCIDPDAVPGVVFSSAGLDDLSHPSFRDFPRLALGKGLKPGRVAPPPSPAKPEDQDVIEERLRSLGYL